MLFVPTAVDAGHYIYFILANAGDYPELILMPWLAPGQSETEFKNTIAPILDTWTLLGLSLSPVYYEYDSFLAACDVALPQETVAFNTSKDTSRLVPR